MKSTRSRSFLLFAACTAFLLLVFLFEFSSGANSPAHVAAGTYALSTSADDPACDTGFGGYVDLEEHGILANPLLSGDNKVWAAFAAGEPIYFYGLAYPGLFITDDGLIIYDYDQNSGPNPQNPQLIPDPAKPNNVAALLWQDMVIVYDAEQNHGISLATFGGAKVIAEYDDVQLAGAPGSTYDFEIVQSRAVDNAPGAYEIVFAYDNLNGPLNGPLTIGLENQAGSAAAVLANQGSAAALISDGLMVCFDYVDDGTPTATPSATVTVTPTGTPTATPTPTAVPPQETAYLPFIINLNS